MARRITLLALCASTALAAARAHGEGYAEKYRPQFHFSPRAGWIGDPDGLIRHDGTYHLFWWGHAESTDLIHWKEQPYPMVGDDATFNYFSGSVVVDRTEGKTPSLVAIYTAHNRANGFEDQRMSVSQDGRYFRYDDRSPVLTEPRMPLRDPDVFWEPKSRRWIMLLVAPEQHKVRFYRSDNLTAWEYLSEFGGAGAQSGNWEVPNLFQLPVRGQEGVRKWVLTCGVGPNRMQYFVGEFDGKQFTMDADTDPARVNWADWGTDFYAARGVRDYDNGGRVLAWIGWMGNWTYARNVPTTWGKGVESIPRSLELAASPQGYRLIQKPWSGLEALRNAEVEIDRRQIEKTVRLTEFQPRRNIYELEAIFEVDGASQDFGLNLCVGGSDKVVLGYDAQNGQVYLDRKASGNVAFHPQFASRAVAPHAVKSGRIGFRVFVDQSSVEVFIDSGETVLTSLVFPDPASVGVELFSRQGGATLRHLSAWELNSIWN